MNTKKSWKKLSSKFVYKNPFFKIREDEVFRPDGKKSKFYLVDMPSSVMTVPINAQNEIYLIGLWRYPTNMYSWEIPSGAVENEDIIASGKRELKEETGLVSDNWQDLGIYQAMNGSNNKIGHVLLAMNVVETEDHKKDDEGITEVKNVPVQEVLGMIKNGEITDSHTITALAVAALKIGII